jgi:DNA-binding LacI/PurR family transcriptional regulator
MAGSGFRTVVDQVASLLREELYKRRWTEVMPGRERLAQEWSVSGKTVEAAMNILEKEGLLARQGAGRRRRITLSDECGSARELRVGILVGEKGILSRNFHVELRHELQKAGHSVVYAPRPMLELGMNVSRIASMVRSMEVDAWIVNAGPREVLEWFSRQDFPVFALFGRRRGLQLAGTGPNVIPALASMVHRLAELGHQRIVFLVRRRHRKPVPSAHIQAFLGELEKLGIQATSYNLPEWEEDAEGFHRCLSSLFQLTPPTALIADEPALFFSTAQFLMHRGIRVPRDVSLSCVDHDPHFFWCRPSVAHITWNTSLVARRVLRWTRHLAQGKQDRHLTFIKTHFVDGDTIGPVRRAQEAKRNASSSS